MSRRDTAQGRKNVSPEVAFGRVLRSIRKSKGLSQEELGARSGYHRTYIGLLERGQKSPSLRTLFDLAATLSVPPSSIVQRVERSSR
ncbi:MAG TPA: helix-turn-helix transcriptional regulator [Candidatus Dormibacteraeota bacterium]|jgi:transcriptional regulator with XRE-family HTH domain|nr:helix-turn-helix transcriptional regulator [Candidatus Dormibacteraeota bacterium]